MADPHCEIDLTAGQSEWSTGFVCECDGSDTVQVADKAEEERNKAQREQEQGAEAEISRPRDCCKRTPQATEIYTAAERSEATFLKQDVITRRG
jgi:hypothetical protein